MIPLSQWHCRTLNCTIVECVHALLHASHLPKLLWAYAVSHVVRLINWTSSKAIEGTTPFELVYGKKPDLKVLREWGDEMLVHQVGGDKLGRCAKQGCWIGYDSKSNGSLIYFSDTGAIKAEHNFCFVNNGCSGLKGEKIPTGKSQSSPRPAESPSEILKAPNSISSMLALLSNTVFNPIIENEKPDNATHDCKADDLPEASVTLVGRPKRILNPSLKAREILEGKAVVLAEDLD